MPKFTEIGIKMNKPLVAIVLDIDAQMGHQVQHGQAQLGLSQG